VSTEASILGLSTARTSEIGRIRPAHPDEGQRLREIAIASKSYWGYDPEWVTEWAALGDFSARALSEKAVYVAEADGRAVAFAVLIPNDKVCILDDLWVEAEWIGHGIGSRLFRFCGEQARRLGAERLEWEAEPNAVGFYERMGARRVRDSARTMWGRVIPVMRADLAALPWSTDE
jgi:GNAT superfamily N-acetyltransferase